MNAAVQILRDRISDIAEQHIKQLFNQAAREQAKVTVLVRFEDDPDGRCDVMVTSDTDDGIRHIVTRRVGEIDTRPLSERLDQLAEQLHIAMGGDGKTPPLQEIVTLAVQRIGSVAELLEAMQFAVRFFDQLTPTDAERMRKVLWRAGVKS